MRLGRAGLAGAVLLALGCFSTTAADAAGTIQPGHLPYPSGGTVAVGAGISLSNENAQLADEVPAKIKTSWHAAPPTCPRSAGSGATSVSVTKKITVVDDVQHRCSFVSAYATSSGKLVWRKKYDLARRAVVVGATVYVQHEDTDGRESLDALALGSGHLRWSSEHVGDGYDNDYAPAVGSGLVMTSLRAVDRKTGATRWSIPSDGTTTGETAATLVVDGRVYVSSSYGVSAFDATVGTRLWGRPRDGRAGLSAGVQRPAVHAGRVYVSGLDATLVFDAETGSPLPSLPGSYRPVAFDGRVGFFTTTRYEESDTVTAVDLEDGHTYWTHRLDRPADGGYRIVTTAPVVSNGLVWIQEGVDTGTKGLLTALDEVTGEVASSRTQTCAPAQSDYATITVAQHRIFTSSACGVLTYVKK